MLSGERTVSGQLSALLRHLTSRQKTDSILFLEFSMVLDPESASCCFGGLRGQKE